MSPHYLQTACKHRSGPTLIANKKSERNSNSQKVSLLACIGQTEASD
jgi:hypothetical protein